MPRSLMSAVRLGECVRVVGREFSLSSRGQQAGLGTSLSAIDRASVQRFQASIRFTIGQGGRVWFRGGTWYQNRFSLSSQDGTCGVIGGV